MSRIGNRKIAIPEGVTVTEENGIVKVTGPKGELTTTLVNGITLKVVEQETTQYPEGKIIGQSRAAGSPITKGTNLTITVAKKPTVKEPEVEETPSEGSEESSETTE